MSRGNPQELEARTKSPVERYLQTWGKTEDPKKAHFQFYDPDHDEADAETGRVSQPALYGVYLDHTVAMYGWDDDSNSRVYSNMARKTDKNPHFRVRLDGQSEPIWDGPYDKEKCKKHLRGYGAAYGNFVFLFDMVSEKIVCLKLRGLALGKWMDFWREQGKKLTENYYIAVKDWKVVKHSKGEACVPVFTLAKPKKDSKDLMKKADAAWEKLEDYFKGYFGRDLDDMESDLDAYDEGEDLMGAIAALTQDNMDSAWPKLKAKIEGDSNRKHLMVTAEAKLDALGYGKEEEEVPEGETEDVDDLPF